ncbi:MAG: hypothetical protein ABJH68_06920 [Ilumatobacter sp.]|uniref:hypothetical protein n=1 Tax=Ilumatobacter sp. TaxID=1967498 RepID=UPI0032978AB1
MRDDPMLLGCSLPDALVNGSHLLGVDAALPEINRAPAADAQVGPHSDPANTFVWADLSDAEVTEVRSVRVDDPRSSFFSDFNEVDTIVLSHEVSGSPLAQIAGNNALVLVGQKYIGTAQEWNVLAALIAAADGSVSFVGPWRGVRPPVRCDRSRSPGNTRRHLPRANDAGGTRVPDIEFYPPT